jgi:hypothetical protein
MRFKFESTGPLVIHSVASFLLPLVTRGGGGQVAASPACRAHASAPDHLLPPLSLLFLHPRAGFAHPITGAEPATDRRSPARPRRRPQAALQPRHLHCASCSLPKPLPPPGPACHPTEQPAPASRRSPSPTSSSPGPLSSNAATSFSPPWLCVSPPSRFSCAGRRELHLRLRPEPTAAALPSLETSAAYFLWEKPLPEHRCPTTFLLPGSRGQEISTGRATQSAPCRCWSSVKQQGLPIFLGTRARRTTSVDGHHCCAGETPSFPPLLIHRDHGVSHCSAKQCPEKKIALLLKVL